MRKEGISEQTEAMNTTFPAPEQFEHLSVLGGDNGWSPPFSVETGSIRTRDPVLEQRAHARYPVREQVS